MGKICKHCGSKHTIKAGRQTNWKGGRKYRVQLHKCRDCGRAMMGERSYI